MPFENLDEGVIEPHFVVKIVEPALMDIFSIAPGLIDLGNEQHVGVYGLHLRNGPLPEGDRDKFGHVATESVNAACRPEEEDVEHLLPCVAVAIV